MTPYTEALDLIRKLDALQRRGLDESDEAEAIRDRADQIWGRLTEADRERLRVAAAEAIYETTEDRTHPA